MEITNFITDYKDISFIECATQEQLDSCFSLRHKIYCEDLQFESIQDDKLEKDDFDAHSTHYIIQNDNVDIGCFRIVPEGTQHLSTMISTKGTFEISRFIIDYQHRHPAILSKVIIKLTALLNTLDIYPSLMILEKRFARFITGTCKLKLERKTDYFELNGRRAAFLYLKEEGNRDMPVKNMN